MGVAKPVLLSDGTSFSKAGDANEYYQAILNSGALKVPLSGKDHDAVDTLFRDYCAATTWAMPGKPMSYHRNWNGAEGRNTKSFYVVYDNGTTDDFSYIKAVKAIANR